MKISKRVDKLELTEKAIYQLHNLWHKGESWVAGVD